jgi:hypothetical protein
LFYSKAEQFIMTSSPTKKDLFSTTFIGITATPTTTSTTAANAMSPLSPPQDNAPEVEPPPPVEGVDTAAAAVDPSETAAAGQGASGQEQKDNSGGTAAVPAVSPNAEAGDPAGVDGDEVDENEELSREDAQRMKRGASRYNNGKSSKDAMAKATKHFNIYGKNLPEEVKKRVFGGKAALFKNVIPSLVTENDMDQFADYLCTAKQLNNKNKALKWNTAERYFSSIKTDLIGRHMATAQPIDKVDWNEANFKKIRAGTYYLYKLRIE